MSDTTENPAPQDTPPAAEKSRRTRRKSKVIRPPGLLVFAGFLVLIAGLWWFFADGMVERGAEE